MSAEKVLISHTCRSINKTQRWLRDCSSLSNRAQAERPVCQHHVLHEPAESPHEDGRPLDKQHAKFKAIRHERIRHPLCHLAVFLRKTLDSHPWLDGLGDVPSVLHAVCHWHDVELVGG